MAAVPVGMGSEVRSAVVQPPQGAHAHDDAGVLGRLHPQDSSARSFCGFLSVRGATFQVRVEAGADGTLASGAVQCDAELRALLPDASVAQLSMRLRRSKSICEFVTELESIVERAMGESTTGNPQGQAPVDVSFYTTIVRELAGLGAARVHTFSHDLRTLAVQASDARGRVHVCRMCLPRDYPAAAPQCRVDVPGRGLQLRWTSGMGLKDVMAAFEKRLATYQDVWDVLDEFDARAWVLEPEAGSRARSITMRRVGLGRFCTLQLEVDPACPRGIPSCRMLGSEAVVGPLRAHLDKHGAALWDESKPLHENLEAALGVPLPSPSESATDEMKAECGICYSYRLLSATSNMRAPSRSKDEANSAPAGGADAAPALIPLRELPSRICENPKCARPFHHACLSEWLRSAPSSRQSFQTVFGSCPYCSSAISVTITELAP